jgi:hypothetical protein
VVGGEGSGPCPRDEHVCRGMILPTMFRLVTQVAPRRKGDYDCKAKREAGCLVRPERSGPTPETDAGADEADDFWAARPASGLQG